jgi:hypothetical protein
MNYYINTCKDCKARLKGRTDKKFCNDYCRNAHHAKENRDISNYIRNINNIFRRNRRILRNLKEKNTDCITKIELIHLGYRMDYFTHENKDNFGSIYKCNYDVGILETKEFILISDELNTNQATFQSKVG